MALTEKKESIAQLLLSFMDVLRRDVQSRLPDTCTFMHVKTLGFIAARKEPSMKDIAEDLRITSPGATMIVDKLVESKDIDRIHDPDDRRVIRLRMTAKGNAVLDKGMKVIKECLDEMASVLTKDEATKFSAILEKLITKRN